GAGVGVTGSGTGTLRLQGTLSNLNAFVAATNVSFITATNAATNVLLTVTVNDDGNTGVDPGASGDGFSEQASTNILLTVTAVNDAPALSVPTSIPCYAGGNCPLTGLSGTDVDDASGAFTLSWSASGGALQAADGGGVTVTGSGTAGLTLSGTLTALNSFIAASNVVFVTPSNLVSDVTVGLVLNDGGQSGLDPGLTGDSSSEQGSASFTLAVAPGVWAVTVPTNGLYQAGDTLEFTVTLSEFVVVDTNGGWPRLVLDIGGTNGFADFVDGSGSNVLTFRHSVQAADHDTNGISVGAAIDLNGGSIVDVSSNSVLTMLRNVPSTAGVLVDGAAPTVVSDSFVMSEDTVLNAPSVLTNDTDLNGDPLTALLVSGATNGVVTLNADGTFTYRPATNFNGVDAFTYQAGDGWLLSTAATVRITVDAVNDAPTLACPLALSCPGPGSCALTGISVSDIDAGVSAARLTIAAAAGTLNAVGGSGVTVTGGGTTSLVLSGLWSDLNLFLAASSVTFTPPPNATNDIPLDVTINDLGNTGADPGASGDANSEAATATLQMAVPPTVVSVTPPTNGVYVAGEALDFAVTVNKVVIVDTNGGFPRLVLDVGGTNRFAHYRDGSGSNVLTFRYMVQTPDRDADGIGVSTNLDFNGGLIVDLASNALPAMLNGVASTAGVLVDGAAPIVGDDAFTMAEDTVLNGSVLANDSDANGDPLSATLVIGPTNGVVSLSTNGTFTYTPATNFHGLDGFTYKVSDGWVYSGVGTVQVSVTNVNDAPLVSIPMADQAGDYTAPFSFTFPAGTFTDVDGDTLTYTATNLPPGIAFEGSTRTFSGSPTNGGTFAISVIASDGQTPALTATNMFHFTVGRLMLTATADNVTRSYSAPNPALTISYAGFVNGDTALALTNPPLATTTATNRSPVGAYPITLNGGSDDRYTFVLSNGTLTVTQALLVATAEDKVKENGAPNPALTIAYTGFAAGDNAGVLDVPPTASTTATT
ncbi:MAG TPA: tandem-95 repeat protein, partial [Candidatus Saccharimonadales bacterium]|nr:tandem-95 repeat protein [Candidatus Saccharimonadales bacterium]